MTLPRSAPLDVPQSQSPRFDTKPTQRPMRHRCGALAGVLAALLGAAETRAELCSDAQAQQIDALYVSVANSPQCLQYAAVLPWSVMVWWSCDDDACVTVMRQLAQALPDCEDPDGVNAKTALAKSVAGCGGGAAANGEASATSDASSSDAPADSTEASTSGSGSSSASTSSRARLRSGDPTDSARSSDAEEA